MTGSPRFLATMERVLQLRTLAPLDRLPPLYLGAIAQRAEERLFRRGALLLNPLNPVGAAYLVVEGQVTVSAGTNGRTEIGPGSTVGFLELLARLDHGVEARAMSDTLTLELDWDTHVGLCDDHFPILHNYLQFLAGQLVSDPARLGHGSGPAGPCVAGTADGRDLNLVERVLALSADHAFSDTSLDAIAELARHAIHVRQFAGQTIWRRGDDAGGFVLLTSGSVTCQAAAGRAWQSEPTLALGLHEALAGSPRWFEATAATPVAGLEIQVAPLLDILEDHLELGIHLMSRLARQLLNIPQRGE
jgi:CRP-like cAMP-binding protein